VLARVEVAVAGCLAAQKHRTARLIQGEALASRFGREVG
jgi:hypothetical protein